MINFQEQPKNQNTMKILRLKTILREACGVPLG